MSIGTFLHGDQNSPTTLSEIKRVHDLVLPSDFLGVFAYATMSGVSSFDMEFGTEFWAETPSRWLFGLDYGRTQPQALRRICEKENTEVRIVDGAWIIDQEGFLPRRDFHAKFSLILNTLDARFGMVVGSGNFSSNGLRKSIEAGAVLYLEDEDAYIDYIASSANSANVLWEQSTPAEDILDAYEERWRNSLFRAANNDLGNIHDAAGPKKIFWIEAGYVTKNRGANSPGNQIDFPRGISRYFGFNPPDNLPVNSIIGEVTFRTPVEGPVTRNLRLGNNHMEKITLPIPETHGFDIYDGKILVFQEKENCHEMRALEADDFETVFGDRLSEVRAMASGRRYGHIE